MKKRLYTKRIEGEHHVPIVVKGRKNKPHIRWIALTASFALGAALGYWVWNRQHGAYMKHPIVKAIVNGDLMMGDQLDIMTKYDLMPK
jgi:uncharacterized membrane-anchored protein